MQVQAQLELKRSRGKEGEKHHTDLRHREGILPRSSDDECGDLGSATFVFLEQFCKANSLLLAQRTPLPHPIG